jgi:hypothetical protein
MRTYWNTKKRDLLRLLEQDEKFMKRDQNLIDLYREKADRNNKIATIITKLADDIVANNLHIHETDFGEGLVYVISPAASGKDYMWQLSRTEVPREKEQQ